MIHESSLNDFIKFQMKLANSFFESLDKRDEIDNVLIIIFKISFKIKIGFVFLCNISQNSFLLDAVGMNMKTIFSLFQRPN